MNQAKITRNGQMSLPAAIRHRWKAGSVLIVDRGGYVIVRPVPEDPVSELQGAYASAAGPTVDQSRGRERAAQRDRESSRTGRAADA